MRTYVFPDVHNLTDVIEELLPQLGSYDRAIYLGDYFDSWGDSTYEARRTAHWLRAKLNDPRNVMLYGNHDIPYAYPGNDWLYCPGYSEAKGRAVEEIIEPALWAKLKTFHVEHGVLFSHAGLSRTFLNWMVSRGEGDVEEYSLPEVVKQLDQWVHAGHGLMLTGFGHRLYGKGQDRGFDQEHGGILWGDFSNHWPLPFPQILGHTPHARPDLALYNSNGKRFSDDIESSVPIQSHFANGWSLDLDTGLRHFAVIDSGAEGTNLSVYKIVIESETPGGPKKNRPSKKPVWSHNID